MDCEQVKERLPWLVNSSLEAAELAPVQQHLKGCERCRQELADTHAALAIFDQHVPAAALVDHVFGRSTAGLSSERITRHLAECLTCQAEHKLLKESQASLTDPVEPQQAWQGRPAGRPIPYWHRLAAAAALVAALTAAGWIWTWNRLQADRATIVELEQQLHRAETASPGRGEIDLAARIGQLERSTQEMASRNSQLTDRLTAAQKLADLLGRRLNALRLPQLNIPIIDLFPASLNLRGDPLVGELTAVPRDHDMVVLVLSTRLPNPGQELQVQLLDADGVVHWQQQGLRLSVNHDFSLHLPTITLAAGTYQLQVLAAAGDPAAGNPAAGAAVSPILETYRFWLE